MFKYSSGYKKITCAHKITDPGVIYEAWIHKTVEDLKKYTHGLTMNSVIYFKH